MCQIGWVNSETQERFKTVSGQVSGRYRRDKEGGSSRCLLIRALSRVRAALKGQALD